MRHFTTLTTCTAALALSNCLLAQAPSNFEKPPIFEASKILPPAMLKGNLHRVRERAPSDGLMILFTLDTDYGTVVCHGLNELSERLNELTAIKSLVETSKTDLFAEGLKRSIEAPIDAVKNISADPAGSLKKAPSTIGHLFKKVGSSISNASKKVEKKFQHSNDDPTEAAVAAGKGLGSAAMNAAGFSKAKLETARKIGVDPYSANPILQKEIEKVTWAFFAGGLPLKIGASAISGGASTALTATTTLGLPEDIYALTPSEIVLRDREAMAKLGASKTLIEQTLINPNLSTSQRHSIVTSLSSLPTNAQSATAILTIAKNSSSRQQSRYLTQTILALHNRHQQHPYSALTTVNRIPLGIITDPAKGSIAEVLAPVDYISWTPLTANFASAQKLPGHSYRLVTSGSMSTLAKSGFAANAWEIVCQSPRSNR